MRAAFPACSWWLLTASAAGSAPTAWKVSGGEPNSLPEPGRFGLKDKAGPPVGELEVNLSFVQGSLTLKADFSKLNFLNLFLI
jgi:hypothetical protein